MLAFAPLGRKLVQEGCLATSHSSYCGLLFVRARPFVVVTLEMSGLGNTLSVSLLLVSFCRSVLLGSALGVGSALELKRARIDKLDPRCSGPHCLFEKLPLVCCSILARAMPSDSTRMQKQHVKKGTVEAKLTSEIFAIASLGISALLPICTWGSNSCQSAAASCRSEAGGSCQLGSCRLAGQTGSCRLLASWQLQTGSCQL